MAKKRSVVHRRNTVLAALLLLSAVILGVIYLKRSQEVITPLTTEEIEEQNREAMRVNETIYSTSLELERMRDEDLRKNGGTDQQLIGRMRQNLQLVVNDYERLLDLRYNGSAVDTYEEAFAEVLAAAKMNDVPATDEKLSDLLASLSRQERRVFTSAAIAATPAIPANVPAVNQAPSAGFRRQKVTAGGRSYLVDIQAADLNSTRVIVDTASESTCTDNCPVLALRDYVVRSGAYAGVNGTYFCPITYPSCAGKTNSFDTLVMNKNKTYFNSDNNVYSTVPAAVFAQGWARFITATRDWGRDTGVDAVIANRPMLTFNNQVMVAGGEAKENVKGNRSFVGATGNIAYIGVVRSASVAQAAQVLQAMGVHNSINLDNGGSTALWSGGYKLGPGRNIPNAVLFVRR